MRVSSHHPIPRIYALREKCTVYCIGAGLAMEGKKVLLMDVDPQGDLTKMLGLRKSHPSIPIGRCVSWNRQQYYDGAA